MTMTVNEGSSSSVPTEDEDDELLTPRVNINNYYSISLRRNIKLLDEYL